VGVSDRDSVADDREIESLLGAFALDACEPDEIERVEAYVARTPSAAAEVERLRTAAAWLGASEALAPPTTLRDRVVATARTRRGADPAARSYELEAESLGEVLDALQPDELDLTTFNGLTVRELAIHLAAMETLAAAAVGVPTGPEIAVTDVDARTAAFVRHFAGRPFDEVLRTWRIAAEAVRAWSEGGATERLEWLGFEVGRDTLLSTRAFENWVHAEDLRRVAGRTSETPVPESLHAMAAFAMGALDVAMQLTGRSHPGCTARIVLTGAGGGSWTVPLAWGETPGAEADVELRADVVAWCLVAAARLPVEALDVDVRGDVALSSDILAAVPAFATL
jgi:uncharacterized protein (TIGR03083 family)